MDALRAIEIEKLKPIKNGIYICIDEDSKKFVLQPLEEIPIKFNGEEIILKEFFYKLKQENEFLQKKIQELQTEHNRLLIAFKRQVIINALK